MTDPTQIARGIVEPNGKELDWCGCYEGDLGNVYKDTKEKVIAEIAAALREYGEYRMDQGARNAQESFKSIVEEAEAEGHLSQEPTDK